MKRGTNLSHAGHRASAPAVELGTRIRAARAYAGLRQDGLATELGVSPDTLSRYEKGDLPRNRLAWPGLIRRIAEVTDLPLAFFVGDFSRLPTGPGVIADEALSALARGLGLDDPRNSARW